MSMFEYLKLKESVNALKDNINAVKTDVANVKTDLANVKTDVNNMPNNITGFDGVSISDLLNGANKIVFPTQDISLMNIIGFTDILSIDGKGYLSTLNFKYKLILNPNQQRAITFMIYVDGRILCHITVTVRPYSTSSGTGDCTFDFTIVKDKHKTVYNTTNLGDATPYRSGSKNSSQYVDNEVYRSASIISAGRQEFPISYRIGDSVFVADFMKYYKDEYNYSNVTPAKSFEKFICRSLDDVLNGNFLQKDIICDSSKTYPRVHAGIYYNDGLGIKFNKNFKIQVSVENPSSADARLTADYILL